MQGRMNRRSFTKLLKKELRAHNIRLTSENCRFLFDVIDTNKDGFFEATEIIRRKREVRREVREASTGYILYRKGREHVGPCGVCMCCKLALSACTQGYRRAISNTCMHGAMAPQQSFSPNASLFTLTHNELIIMS